MNTKNEQELNKHIRQDLDDSVDVLDANTLSKIRQIRAQAVDRAADKQAHGLFSRPRFLAGSLATVCVMVLAVVVLLNSPTSVNSVPLDDLELISSSDNLELFEDLEFYEWLEEDGLPS